MTHANNFCRLTTNIYLLPQAQQWQESLLEFVQLPWCWQWHIFNINRTRTLSSATYRIKSMIQCGRFDVELEKKVSKVTALHNHSVALMLRCFFLLTVCLRSVAVTGVQLMWLLTVLPISSSWTRKTWMRSWSTILSLRNCCARRPGQTWVTLYRLLQGLLLWRTGCTHRSLFESQKDAQQGKETRA